MAEVIEKLAGEINEKIDGFKKELSEAVSKAELKSLEDKLTAFETEQKDNKLPEEVKDLKEQIRQLKDSGIQPSGISEDVFVAIEKGLTDLIPSIKKAISERNGAETPWEIAMEVKAPVNMTTGSITNVSSTPVAYVYQQVTEYAEDVRPEEYIINYLDNGTTNKAVLPYMDKLPTQGTMAITAEGALKPLISVSFQLRYSTAQKIAGRTKISEEALDDIPNLMAIIRNELMYEHRMAEQSTILTFIDGFAPAFVAGEMAGSTDAPSNYDAIRAAIYAVKIQSNNRYVPNAVFVKSADVYNMGATKDTTNQYVFPPFVLPDGTRIAGVRVVEVADDSIEDDTFIVGDFRKVKRRVYKAFNVRIGQGIQMNATAANIVSDFESNMYTMIGESRLHLWVHENEKVAFVKDTFTAVKTAIETAP